MFRSKADSPFLMLYPLLAQQSICLLVIVFPFLSYLQDFCFNISVRQLVNLVVKVVFQATGYLNNCNPAAVCLPIFPDYRSKLLHSCIRLCSIFRRYLDSNFLNLKPDWEYWPYLLKHILHLPLHILEFINVNLCLSHCVLYPLRRMGQMSLRINCVPVYYCYYLLLFLFSKFFLVLFCQGYFALPYDCLCYLQRVMRPEDGFHRIFWCLKAFFGVRKYLLNGKYAPYVHIFAAFECQCAVAINKYFKIMALAL